MGVGLGLVDDRVGFGVEFDESVFVRVDDTDAEFEPINVIEETVIELLEVLFGL